MILNMLFKIYAKSKDLLNIKKIISSKNKLKRNSI